MGQQESGSGVRKAAGKRRRRINLRHAVVHVRHSRLRAFIPVLAIAAGLLVLVPAKPTSAIGKCRQDAGPSVDWSDCPKRLLMLNGSNLDGANLDDADFSMTDLSRSSLKGANLSKATLVRASFAHSDISGAIFDKAEGYRSDFSSAKAEGASFVAAELQRATFGSADLKGADFTKAELGRAIFFKAQFENVRFDKANLSRAVLHNVSFAGTADFSDAFLFLTRIEGTDLSDAQGLKQDQIALACGDSLTKLPPGLTTPATWPCEDD